MDYCQAFSPLLKQVPLHCAQDGNNGGSSCLQAIEQAFFESCRLLGFAYVRFSCWTRFIDDENQVRYWYSINFTSFPASWETYYEKHQLYLHDPVVRLIQENDGVMPAIHGTWDAALAYALTHPLGDTDNAQEQYCRQVRALYADAAAYQLQQGCYFSGNDGKRHVAISLAQAGNSTAAEPDPSLWQTLFGLATVLNQSIGLTSGCEQCVVSLRTGGMPALQISPTQTRVLRLFLRFPTASVKEIAGHIGTGPDAVNYHLKTLRQRLGKPGASGLALAQFAHEHNLL